MADAPSTDSVVADLDALIQAIGEQLSAAVTNDDVAVRRTASTLGQKLDGLRLARAVVAGADSGLVVSS